MKAKDKLFQIWKTLLVAGNTMILQDKLKEFQSFNDEKLRGERGGQRSSRLNVKYRVIYTVEETVVTVRVLEITPHEY